MHKKKNKLEKLFCTILEIMSAASSAVFWQFGKKLIFFLSIIIKITLSKLLCIVSLTLVICRHLLWLKTVPHTEKTGVELCKSKPHISAWMRKVRAMLDIKKTYQVQRSAINLVSAWSQADLFCRNTSQRLFLFYEYTANHGHVGFESINVIGHSQILEYYTAFLEVLNIYIHSS